MPKKKGNPKKFSAPRTSHDSSTNNESLFPAIFLEAARATPAEISFQAIGRRDPVAGSTLPRQREITQEIMAVGGTTTACRNKRERDRRYRGNAVREEITDEEVYRVFLVEERRLKKGMGRRKKRGSCELGVVTVAGDG